MTRAWRLVKFMDNGMLALTPCSKCGGHFVTHPHEIAKHFVCGLCNPPARAGKGKAAGLLVTEGVVRKGARVRIIRDDVVVLELGVLNTLKRFKDEVNEVPSGQECGMQFQGFQDIKEGDYIECFTVEEIKRTLD